MLLTDIALTHVYQGGKAPEPVTFTLHPLRTDDGETVYRRCGTSHHHHLVCRECGRTVEVEAPDVERWATAVAAQHGFADVAHTLEIFGVCDRH